MKITVIGTGYVGLVTGACFAEVGNNVACIDVEAAKIEKLRQGILPIYEPGLEAIVTGNLKEGRLKFYTDLNEAEEPQIYFIAVGTPSDGDGAANVHYVLQAASAIGARISQYTIIANKSTVPIGTAEKVRQTIQEELQRRGVDVDFDVVSNPEFLKQGAAVNDFMKPDRIIVGCESAQVRDILHSLYAPFVRNHDRILFMDVKAAELTKYAANAMLATKISFMNEIANICDLLGVDVEDVRKGIGSDSRIGYDFIYPGCGYGGSCFPKDVKALIRIARDNEFDPQVLEAIHARNERQKYLMYQKIVQYFGSDLSGKTFGLWGMAFKPGTDDLREAPSLVLIKELVHSGAVIKAYDPVAMDNVRRQLPEQWFAGKIELAENQYAALKNVDALILVTEWKPFRYPDFDLMKRIMRQTVIFDGRNQYDPEALSRMGFKYFGVGRSNQTL